MYAVSILLLCVFSAHAEWEVSEWNESEFIPNEIPGSLVAYPLSTGNAAARAGLMESVKQMCSCSGKECKCCYGTKVTFVTVEACVKAEMRPKEQSFFVGLTVGGITTKSVEVSIKDHKYKCMSMKKTFGNIKELQELELCIHTTFDEITPEQVTSCLSLDVVYEKEKVAIFNFQCLHYSYKEQKLTFTDSHKVQEGIAMLTLKNPAEAIMNIVMGILAQK